jgi:hypothetical protein
MTQVTLNSISGLNPPYTIYACNIYGLSCVIVDYITVPVPSTVTINLPSPQFDLAPVVGIRVVASDGCEKFEVVYCTPTPTPTPEPKEFQDYVFFEFMDGVQYDFQN